MPISFHFCYINFILFIIHFVVQIFPFGYKKKRKIRMEKQVKKLYYFGNMVVCSKQQKNNKDWTEILCIFKWNFISFLWTLIINRFPTNQGNLHVKLLHWYFGKPAKQAFLIMIKKHSSVWCRKKVLRFCLSFVIDLIKFGILSIFLSNLSRQGHTVE